MMVDDKRTVITIKRTVIDVLDNIADVMLKFEFKT